MDGFQQDGHEAMFNKPVWETLGEVTHNKKVLPPLQNTVEVYRNVKKGSKSKKRTNMLKNGLNNNYNQEEQVAYDMPETVGNHKINTNARNSHLNSAYTGFHYGNDEVIDVDESQINNNKINFCAKTEEIVNDSTDEELEETNIDYCKMALDLASGKPAKDLASKRRKRALPDFVLVYDCTDHDSFCISEREQFENNIAKEGIEIGNSIIKNHTFVELYVSFERLCKAAEDVALEMPLEGFLLDPKSTPSFLSSFSKSMETDSQVDMVSAPFTCASREMFQGIENESTFFRSTYRSLLVKHILERLSISISEAHSIETQKKTGLTSMILSGAYKDAFILNERSQYDNIYPLTRSLKSTLSFTTSAVDSRKELHNTWLKCLKYQPLWKIRNYYGEKIALYFAWLGVLITSLWIPTLLGILIFIYGFFISYNKNKSEISATTVTAWTTSAFDNDATPYFALIICIWGTVFCEFWKRQNAELAYKWDVDLFEEQETKRPQFVGTIKKKDPVTGELEEHYPRWQKVLKSMGSTGVILFMVILVVSSVTSVVVFKVVSRVDWFKSLSKGELASSLTSSILNTISILILGRVYKTIAYKLTEWENHKTKTKYEDALIFKLFGFQFVNSYASLFYIAFFRKNTSQGLFALGTEYSDSCGTDGACMSMLSLQVAVLMIAKPMPKFFADIILPFLLKYARKICCCFKSSNVINTSTVEMSKGTSRNVEYEKYLEEEYKKPPLTDFTLSEYTEKVLQYGYLMMFAAAFPLAPLIALITNLIDLRVDARRMLWFNRRPFPERAEDIGMWFTILNFLNFVGMFTNALIIGLTSRYGSSYKTGSFVYNLPANVTMYNSMTNTTSTSVSVKHTTNDNLWIIIIFENIVLAVKFVLAYIIADVPGSVLKAKSQEKVQLGKLLTRSGMALGPGKTFRKQDTSATPGEPMASTPKKRNNHTAPSLEH